MKNIDDIIPQLVIEDVVDRITNNVFEEKVEIAARRDGDKKNILFFLMKTEKKMNFFMLAEFSARIKSILDMADNDSDSDNSPDIRIIISEQTSDPENIEKNFEHVVFSKDNIKKVEEFLIKHYPDIQFQQKEEKTSETKFYGDSTKTYGQRFYDSPPLIDETPKKRKK